MITFEHDFDLMFSGARLQTCEKTLASLHRYDECQEMRRRVQIRMNVELTDFRNAIADRACKILLCESARFCAYFCVIHACDGNHRD